MLIRDEEDKAHDRFSHSRHDRGGEGHHMRKANHKNSRGGNWRQKIEEWHKHKRSEKQLKDRWRKHVKEQKKIRRHRRRHPDKAHTETDHTSSFVSAGAKSTPAISAKTNSEDSSATGFTTEEETRDRAEAYSSSSLLRQHHSVPGNLNLLVSESCLSSSHDIPTSHSFSCPTSPALSSPSATMYLKNRAHVISFMHHEVLEHMTTTTSRRSSSSSSSTCPNQRTSSSSSFLSRLSLSLEDCVEQIELEEDHSMNE